MKLRNKKTGAIVDLIEIVKLDDISNECYLRLSDSEGRTFKIGFNSLAELNDEWEDYEEPKEWYWFIGDNGVIQRSCHYEDLHPSLDKARKKIGNYFSSREEAEKAVEKLKAWKRLKDKGFRFSDFCYTELCDYARINIKATMINDSINNDLNLLFGGEE